MAAAASKVAMHAVAVSPRFLDPASVPEDVMEGEMAILRAQTENAGKPANIVEKIVAGRMKKFYEETCLSNQKFVMDDSKTVGKWLAGRTVWRSARSCASRLARESKCRRPISPRRWPPPWRIPSDDDE